MARETRRQRRDARRAAGDGATPAPRSSRRPPADAGAQDGAPSEWGANSSGALAAPTLVGRPTRSGPIGSLVSFVRESVAELKKVEWPNRGQVVQGTVVVLIACAIVGTFLYGADQAIRPLVKHVFLGQ